VKIEAAWTYETFSDIITRLQNLEEIDLNFHGRDNTESRNLHSILNYDCSTKFY